MGDYEQRHEVAEIKPKQVLRREVTCLRRILILFLTLAMLLSMTVGVQGATAAKKEPKRVIGIVFDNSGSMYVGSEEGRKAWCRATYATEVFAAMMNPDDILLVYPMNPIEVDGQTYTYDNPLMLNQSSASKIREIYTPRPGDTHIETITAACEGVMQMQADEKWLVVLTDGDEFYRNGVGLGKGQATISALEQDLSACGSKVNMMYLGMGSQSAMPNEVSHDYIYVAKKTATSQEVLTALSDMCNMIFGRDRLTVVSNSINFDIPMSRLFVFVQGEGIKNVQLGDLKASSTVEVNYSTLGGGGGYQSKFLVDKSLQGVLVVYEDVDPAQLKINFEGKASSVDCFYEPNVELSLELLDQTGNPVDLAGTPANGTYQLAYSLVDEDGKKVTSPLLGKTSYTLTYFINGEKYMHTSEAADAVEVQLSPNDVLDAKVRVTYLSGYTLEKTAHELGWPEGGLVFIPPPAGYFEVKIKGLETEYQLSNFLNGAKVDVDFIYEGQTLSGAQLDGLEDLQVTLEGGNAKANLVRGDDGYYVQLSPYDVAHETESGEYTLRVSGTYCNEDGQKTNQASDSATFLLTNNGRVLEMDVDVLQHYYQISKIAEGEPIKVTFSYSGQPLTEEELNALELDIQSEGLSLITERNPEDSSVTIKIDPESSPKPGKHSINIGAKGENEIGEPQNCQDTAKVKTGVLPNWLRGLLPFLLLLLLLLLIILFLNQKVLPKDVGLKDAEFSVDGSKIQGSNAKITNPGKKRSEIVIDSAKYSLDPGAPQQITMSVTALTNRLTPSAKRRYVINSVKLRNATQVQTWEVKGAKYKADSEKPGNFKSVANGGAFKEVMAGPKTPFFVKSETRQGTVVTFRGTLISK